MSLGWSRFPLPFGSCSEDLFLLVWVQSEHARGGSEHTNDGWDVLIPRAPKHGSQLLCPGDLFSVAICLSRKKKILNQMLQEGFLIVALWCQWVAGSQVWVYISLGVEAAELLFLTCPCIFMHRPSSGSLVNFIFYSGVFRRKVCHSSLPFSFITAVVTVVRGRRQNQLFRFSFLPGKSPRAAPALPHFLRSESVGKFIGLCFWDDFSICSKRGAFADSPGVGPVILRCGLVRAEQSFNYLLGAQRILQAGEPRAIPEKKANPRAFCVAPFLGLKSLMLANIHSSPQCHPHIGEGQQSQLKLFLCAHINPSNQMWVPFQTIMSCSSQLLGTLKEPYLKANITVSVMLKLDVCQWHFIALIIVAALNHNTDY